MPNEHEQVIPVGRTIGNSIEFLEENLSGLTNALANTVDVAVNTFTDWLMWPPDLPIAGFPSIIILFTFISWWVCRRFGVTIFVFLGLLLIWDMGFWQETMKTLSLILFSTLVAVALGVPLGILAGLSLWFHRIIRPILDLMQTLPPFVYLLPAIAFFSLGNPPGLFATVIFAMPPVIRLTDLGIRQVDPNLIEAADAFGSTRFQKLVKLQLPFAIVSIRAGINQTVMLALSMVVIAALVGAEGLGASVWKGIQRNDIPLGFESGIAIVIVAIALDRVLQSIGKNPKAQD